MIRAGPCSSSSISRIATQGAVILASFSSCLAAFFRTTGTFFPAARFNLPTFSPASLAVDLARFRTALPTLAAFRRAFLFLAAAEAFSIALSISAEAARAAAAFATRFVVRPMSGSRQRVSHNLALSGYSRREAAHVPGSRRPEPSNQCSRSRSKRTPTVASAGTIGSGGATTRSSSADAIRKSQIDQQLAAARLDHVDPGIEVALTRGDERDVVRADTERRAVGAAHDSTAGGSSSPDSRRTRPTKRVAGRR